MGEMAMDNFELPDGWELMCLGEIKGKSGLFTDGDWIISSNMDLNGSIRLLQLADVGVGVFLDKSAKFINKKKFAELGCTEVKPEDVLISRMGDPIARACIVPQTEQKMIAAVDISIVRVDPKIVIPQFITFACNSPLVTEQAEALSRGSTRKRISRKDLEKIKIPVPPLSEQRRIVAKIEQLTSRLEKAIELQKKAIEETEDLIPSIISKNLALDDLKYKPLSLLIKIDTNSILPIVQPEKKFNYVALENIESNSGLLVNFEPTIGANIKSNKFVFDERHVLLGKLRPYLNKVLLPSFSGICSTDILPLLPNSKLLTREYLAFSLRSQRFVEYSKVCMQGAKMPRLRTEDLKNFEIAVPSLPVQKKIVVEIENIQCKAQQLKQLQAEAEAELAAFTPALLAKAFRGEL